MGRWSVHYFPSSADSLAFRRLLAFDLHLPKVRISLLKRWRRYMRDLVFVGACLVFHLSEFEVPVDFCRCFILSKLTITVSGRMYPCPVARVRAYTRLANRNVGLNPSISCIFHQIASHSRVDLVCNFLFLFPMKSLCCIDVLRNCDVCIILYWYFLFWWTPIFTPFSRIHFWIGPLNLTWVVFCLLLSAKIEIFNTLLTFTNCLPYYSKILFYFLRSPSFVPLTLDSCTSSSISSSLLFSFLCVDVVILPLWYSDMVLKPLYVCSCYFHVSDS